MLCSMGKQILRGGLCVLALAAAMAGAHAEEIKGEIQFTWWGANIRHEKTNAVADLFEAAHPGARILREPQDWTRYWERLNVRAAGGSMPCVTSMLSFNLNDYTGNNLLADLEPLVKGGQIRVDGISEDILALGRGADGKLYMIPYGAAPDTITYNASLAERSGITPLSGDYTWDDYFQWLREAKAKLPDNVYASDYPSNYPNVILAYIASHGHDVFTDGKLGFPQQVLVDWWTAWKSLSDDGVIIPPDMLAEQPVGHEMTYLATGRVLASARPANAFAALQTRMADNGDKAETFLFPLGPSGVGDILPANGLSIPVTCNNIPTAAAFIDFFTSDPEATKVFESNNGAVTVIPLLQKQKEDPNTPAAVRKILEVFEQVNERGARHAAFPAGFQATFGDTHRRLSQEVLFGLRTPEDAAAAFFSALN